VQKLSQGEVQKRGYARLFRGDAKIIRGGAKTISGEDAHLSQNPVMNTNQRKNTTYMS
jgi:hypothetical protein